MEDGVDVGGVVVLENGRLDEFHVFVEVVRVAEVRVVDGDHIVVLREAVREVRSDEARAACDEDALVVHVRS